MLPTTTTNDKRRSTTDEFEADRRRMPSTTWLPRVLLSRKCAETACAGWLCNTARGEHTSPRTNCVNGYVRAIRTHIKLPRTPPPGVRGSRLNNGGSRDRNTKHGRQRPYSNMIDKIDDSNDEAANCHVVAARSGCHPTTLVVCNSANRHMLDTAGNGQQWICQDPEKRSTKLDKGPKTSTQAPQNRESAPRVVPTSRRAR